MFTAKNVVEAYEITGLKPIYGSFFNMDYTCACALSALYAAKKDGMDAKESLKILRYNSKGLDKVIIETIGIDVKEGSTKDFVTDFYIGYDQPDHVCDDSNEVMKFGASIRREVENLLGRKLLTTYQNY